MGTVELIAGAVVIVSLWLFIRAFRKGVRYWNDSSPHRHDEE